MDFWNDISNDISKLTEEASKVLSEVNNYDILNFDKLAEEEELNEIEEVNLLSDNGKIDELQDELDIIIDYQVSVNDCEIVNHDLSNVEEITQHNVNLNYDATNSNFIENQALLVASLKQKKKTKKFGKKANLDFFGFNETVDEQTSAVPLIITPSTMFNDNIMQKDDTTSEDKHVTNCEELSRSQNRHHPLRFTTNDDQPIFSFFENIGDEDLVQLPSKRLSALELKNILQPKLLSTVNKTEVVSVATPDFINNVKDNSQFGHEIETSVVALKVFIAHIWSNLSKCLITVRNLYIYYT